MGAYERDSRVCRLQSTSESEFVWEICSECTGLRYVPSSLDGMPIPCTTCHGVGVIRRRLPEIQLTFTDQE
jgi:DnaJ-class molecular chaperone